MLRLFFVRHGRTTWNAEGRVQGGGNLDPVGLAQVIALARSLRDQRFGAAYCSPYPRTRQTANVIAGLHGVAPRLLPLLRDLDYGNLSGALLSVVRDDDPLLWEQWHNAPETVQFPGGESLGGLRRRMRRAIDILIDRHPEEDVLCVTHDSPVRVAASLALGLDDSHHNDDGLVTPTASLTIIGAGPAGLTLELHRDTVHLKGIDARV